MAAWHPGDGGAPRGGTPVERYIRELLRDAERMGRASRRSGRTGAARPPAKVPPRHSNESENNPPGLTTGTAG
jgi:hypothetical protein